jgi:uncharacterized repeat protein (TIGR01451 family)
MERGGSIQQHWRWVMLTHLAHMVLHRATVCLLPVGIGIGLAATLLLSWQGRTPPAYAGTLTVNPGESIQAAIDAASTGDTILINPATYSESLTLTKVVSLTGVSSATVIVRALSGQRVITVSGAAIDHNVIISGLTFMGGQAVGSVCPAGCGGGVALLDGAQPLLTDLRFISNTALTYGGGIFAFGNLTVANTQFVSNTAFVYGGGLFTYGGVTLIDAQFVSNTARSGGGGGLFSYGGVTLTGTDFLSNTALQYGGGLFTYGGVTLTGTQFIGNSAHSGGGGGLYAAGLVSLAGSDFMNNTAGSNGGGLYAGSTARLAGTHIASNTAAIDGGGLYALGVATLSGGSFVNNLAASGYGGGLNAGAATSLTGTSFISNTAGLGGGGAYLTGGDTGTRRFVNGLLVGNRAGSHGDGLFLNFSAGSALILQTTFAEPGLAAGAGVYVLAGKLGITNTIFAGQTVGIEQTGGAVFQDYNLFFSNGANTTGTVSGGAHSLTGNPRFVSPAGNDYHLDSGSLAIDAGTNAGVLTDFEGDPRPQGAGFDIGFDESPFTALADVGVTKSAGAAARQPGQTLTYTLVYSNSGPEVAPLVRLTDVVPANLVAVTYTSSGAALTPVGQSPYDWQVADLPPGAGGIVTVTGVLSGGLHGTVFTNTATITSAYSDTHPANNTSATSVTVANVAPVAADDVYTVTGNTTLTVTAPGVLDNDSDANNDVLKVSQGTGPLTGTLSLHADGSFTYTPPHGFASMVTFTYRADDGQAQSSLATVTITVTAVQFKLYLPVVLR